MAAPGTARLVYGADMPKPRLAVFLAFGGLLLALVALLLPQQLELAWAMPWAFPLSCVVIPVAGMAAVGRRDVLSALGLRNFEGRGCAVAALGSLAMLAGLAIGAPAPPVVDVGSLFDGAVKAALTEELLFRGFAFGLLYRVAGWRFAPAMLTTGAIFGGFHLPAAILGGHLDQAWGAALLTGVGGCWFAWLYARWGFSLWVAITAHLSINLWWALYAAGPTAVGGGPGATWGRVAAIAIITIATLKMTDPGVEHTSG